MQCSFKTNYAFRKRDIAVCHAFPYENTVYYWLFLCFQDAVTPYATDSGRPVFNRLWLTWPVREALHQHHLILASEAEYLLR